METRMQAEEIVADNILLAIYRHWAARAAPLCSEHVFMLEGQRLRCAPGG
jgi:hypothetical protein